jgi:hypothetical protein
VANGDNHVDPVAPILPDDPKPTPVPPGGPEGDPKPTPVPSGGPEGDPKSTPVPLDGPETIPVSNPQLVAPNLPVGESTSGNISYGAEHDYHPISLTAGESYIFDVHGSSLSDSTLALHDGAGTMVAFNDDGGPGWDSRVEYTAPTSGTYYLNVGSYNNSYTGDYTLSTRVDDVADDIYTTDSTTPDGWSWGTINSAADQDYYGIHLTQGQNYTFDAYAVPGGLSDPTLAVHDSDGIEVAYNDDYGGTLDAHIDFTAPSDGMYYLDVGGYNDHTGSYLLVA